VDPQSGYGTVARLCRPLRRAASMAALGVWLGCCCGCPVTQNVDVPGIIQRVENPEGQYTYYLYVPSYYKPRRVWALVVTCHGTPPWDTAERQIKEFVDLAERKGFLVASPELRGTRGDFVPSPPEQIARQLADEKVILSVVSQIQAAYNVGQDRVFLTGWSAGGYAVLFTGLRHPEVFRALAVRQGNFDPRFLEPCLPFLDPYQPICVIYGSTDLLKSQAEACLQWLRDHHMFVSYRETVGAHRRHPEEAYKFFRKCLERYPWIRVYATGCGPARPTGVRFRAVCSPKPVAYSWDFGDGQKSSEVRPLHVYRRKGEYTVRLSVRLRNGRVHSRTVRIQVPPALLGVSAPSTMPAIRG